MDLSKAFDTINHELLLSKLHTYSFGKQDLLIIGSHLTNHQQGERINNAFSSWRDLLQRVPGISPWTPIN